MNNDSTTHLIAQQMELLASLGVSLPTQLEALCQACTDTLLNGGKLILISDQKNQFCDHLLSHLLHQGESLERPPLPHICMRLCYPNETQQNTGAIEHIYHDNDLILAIADDSQLLEHYTKDTPYNAYGIYAKSTQHSSPAVVLNTHNRAQWHIAATLSLHALVQRIEQQLFGYNQHG